MHTDDSLTADIQVLAIVGPTGVGKSDLAEDLALGLSGEIVSADAMQVYRGMDIGTAKTPANERRVPYHCLDLREPGEPYSAALFQADARAAIESCHQRGRLPILCGGTGLYVRAALDDFSFPEGEQQDNPVRDRYERDAAVHGSEWLHALLAKRDPASAALIHPNNVRRVIRALEMLGTGTSYAEQAQGFSDRRSIYGARFLGLTMEREALYTRINRRVDLMVERGLVDEVQQLLDRGLRHALTAAQAIGYKELVDALEGRDSIQGAIARIKQATRRYAKRQLTWFRADHRVVWLDVTGLSSEERLLAAREAVR